MLRKNVTKVKLPAIKCFYDETFSWVAFQYLSVP